MSISRRTQSQRLSRTEREGFSPIPTDQQYKMGTNDATIDIPLEQVSSYGQGLRSQGSAAQLNPSGGQEEMNNEKHTFSRGRRQKRDANAPNGGKIGYDGEEETVTTMGKVYYKIANFSMFTRYFLYMVPLGIIIAIPIIIGATVAPKAELGSVRIVWFFMWVEVVWLSLWVSKAVAHYLPIVFQLIAGVVSSGVRKYALVLKALEIPLSLVGWAVTALATFVPVMTHNPTKWAQHDAWCDATGSNCKLKDGTAVTNPLSATSWMTIVQKILAAALIASIVFAIEKAIIQLISINYHRKQFNARIKSSKRNVQLLGFLYDASRSLFPQYCNEFAEEDYAIADQLDLTFGLGSGKNSRNTHARSGSRTPMRFIQNIGRYGDQITSVFGNVAHEITGKDVFNPNSAHSIVTGALEKKRTSEALAKRLWMSFVIEGHDSLYYEDIADVMGPQQSEAADESFTALDRDGNGDISLDEMILTICEFSRERKAIANSMHDVDQAINVLDRLLCAVVFIAVIFIFVAFLNANFMTTLATTGTALLSLSFVFAVTAQEVLGSCIFLFVKHPYDIGDRVDIGSDQLVVEHISLLFTVFRRVSGQFVGRSVQIPNIVLNTVWIENVSRSGAMTEQHQVDIAYDTSFDDLQLLKRELHTFVTDKENSRDFQPEIGLQVLGTSDMSKMSIQVELKHKSNWSNETVRMARRSKFMCALMSALKLVPIHGPGGGGDAAGSAANPNYSVSISDTVAKENATASAKSKDAARLVPNAKIEEDKQPLTLTSSGRSAAGLTSRDYAIVSNLANPNPAFDPVRDTAWSPARDDSSTLGERPSVDRSDLNELSGMLRRESTRGKRKAGETTSKYSGLSVPKINELQNTAYQDYAQPSTSTYPPFVPPGPAPTYSIPPVPTSYTSYGQPAQATQAPTRSPSNPYRKRSESINRKPLGQPSDHVLDEDEDPPVDTRPYSGV
ncbi:hypothetical protein K431DRAFT_281364 [Polychaeton citri CBS 116435]|uniref:EF-hand domain-containing protein n=1 Tax=Polychaeton citri CBS 116435 TaxID=1314669 RepID=A0A9P4USD0_9PEZI|nr:hypothetical protein K431DRAFT_281364 [Polychaeton citri CBS 116435]